MRLFSNRNWLRRRRSGTHGLWSDLYDTARQLDVRAIQVDGSQGRFLVSPNDKVIGPYYARHGVWSGPSVTTIKNFFSERQPGLYIDVGANIGLTTVPIAATGVRCLAVEADPANASLLEDNLRLNGVNERVVVDHCAAGDRTGTCTFELSADNHGDHRIRTAGGEGKMNEASRRVIEVPMKRLDDIVEPDISGAIAIKVDVQGAEALVFNGARQTMNRADLIIMEFWPYGLNRAGASTDTMIEIIRRFDRVTIARDNDQYGSKTLTAGAAGDQLASLLGSRAQDHDFFVDVTLTRTRALGA